jgi:hypothetical protein
MVGKYLRLFAIKSDEERRAKAFDTGPGASLISDDFDPETDKQLQLRDCEGHLKRIFSLCLNDRYACLCLSKYTMADYKQSTTRRITKMGYLLCHQPPLQDLLQVELSLFVKNYSQDTGCVQ